MPLPLRFMFAAEPEEVLPIFYRAIAGHLIKKSDLTRGQTGAVTLIQGFGSALNLIIHFHMRCLDGAYVLGSREIHQ